VTLRGGVRSCCSVLSGWSGRATTRRSPTFDGVQRSFRTVADRHSVLEQAVIVGKYNINTSTRTTYSLVSTEPRPAHSCL